MIIKRIESWGKLFFETKNHIFTYDLKKNIPELEPPVTLPWCTHSFYTYAMKYYGIDRKFFQKQTEKNHSQIPAYPP